MEEINAVPHRPIPLIAVKPEPSDNEARLPEHSEADVEKLKDAGSHRPIPLLENVKPEPSDNEYRLLERSEAVTEKESRDDESHGDTANINVEATAEAGTSAVEKSPMTTERAIQPVAADKTATTHETTTETAGNQTPLTAASVEVPLPSVKAEPVAAEDTETNVPDSFFDDLLQTADEIQAAVCPSNDESNTAHVHVKREHTDVASNGMDAAAPTSISAAEEAVGDAADEEPIPQNFFDDLLVDRVAERLDNVQNQELEVKYSDRLRELQRLEEKERKKAHKKKKKKSQKRSHSDNGDRSGHKRRRQSHSQSPKRNDEVPHLRVRQGLDVDEVESSAQCSGSKRDYEVPRLRITQGLDFNEVDSSGQSSLFPHTPAESQELPSTSTDRRSHMYLRVKSEFDELCLPVQQTERFRRRNMNGLILDETTPLGFHRIKLEENINEPQSMCVKESLEVLTPTEKRKRATHRAIIVIEEFKKLRQQQDAPLSSFFYTSTVRKLPSNLSYVTQQIYDNRSPLHTVNNVSYKFSSHVTQCNLREWGLEALPCHAAKVAKILGYDAHTLSSKLQTFKLPPKLQRVKREQNAEAVDEVRSSFYTNAMTQTNDVTVLDGRQRSGYDIGVQTEPSRNSVAVQTINSGLTAADTCINDELPLMQQLNQLNEYQLLALSDFAELIREPSSTDVYRVRMRMLEIYKCAQMSPAIPLQPPFAAQNSDHELSYEPTPSALPPPQQQRIRRDPRHHQPVPQQYTRAVTMLPHYEASAQTPPRPQIPAPHQSHVYSASHRPRTHQQMSALHLPQNSHHYAPHPVGHPPRTLQSMPVQHLPQNEPHHAPLPAVPHATSTKFYGRGGMRH